MATLTPELPLRSALNAFFQARNTPQFAARIRRGMSIAWLTLLYAAAQLDLSLAADRTAAEVPSDVTGNINFATNAPTAPGFKTGTEVLAAIGRKEIKLITPPTNMPPGVVEEKNLEYGKVDNRSLRLDLFHPEKSHKPAPGLIFIHGGGWGGGDRNMLRYYAVRYAEKGYVTACISYRLSGEKTPGNTGLIPRRSA
jgi:acetyl esterase/lipase